MTIAFPSSTLAAAAPCRPELAWAEHHAPALAAVAAVTLLTLAQLGLILWRLGGHFSYSLDDPYIHLALADQIAQGHYGLNAGEAAAPSSSILFPVLLAGLSFTGLGQFACLAIGSAASLWSGVLIANLLARSLAPVVLSRLASTLIAVSLILSFNLIGLEFTGLEHSLHVGLTLACLLGALRFLKTGALPPWWWLCALAEPLVRYEGASLWVGMACLMLYRGRWVAGLGLLGAGAVLLGLFSLFLHGLGLPPLPSSVLVKSYVAAVGAGGVSAGLLDGFKAMLAESLTSFGMIRLVILCGLLVALMIGHPKLDGERRAIAQALATLALFVSLGHILLGRFGWFSRYEIYVVAFDVMVLIYGYGPLLGRLLGGPRRPGSSSWRSAPWRSCRPIRRARPAPPPPRATSTTSNIRCTASSTISTGSPSASTTSAGWPTAAPPTRSTSGGSARRRRGGTGSPTRRRTGWTTSRAATAPASP